MRNVIELTGVVLILQGLSGAIDHLAVQPFVGVFLSAFNRFVLPRIDALDGYELSPTSDWPPSASCWSSPPTVGPGKRVPVSP